MNRSGYCRLGGFALGLSLLVGTAQASADFSLAVGDDDNLVNAPDFVPEVSSTYYELSARRSWRVHQGASNGLELGLAGSGRNVVNVPGLSRLSIGGVLNGWWALGRGFYAPVIYADGRFENENYQAGEQRDGNRWQLGLSLVGRMTTQLSGQLQIRQISRDADGPAWDGDQLRYGLGLRWQPLERLGLDARYDEMSGDVPVSVDRFFAQVNSISQAVEQDWALPGFLAYRVDAEGSVATLGLEWRWTPTATIRVQGLWADSESVRQVTQDNGPGPDGPADPGPMDPAPMDPGPAGPGPDMDADDGTIERYPTYQRLQTSVSLIVRF